ncbi:hypothetical protein MSG28_006015 [Choristoneura fumiferana]|uniref:Uncharacterized protein n=1 Tax=Choristoneura fumiferana TaxID=7141 RepID=A0ACC0L1R4_CHOFU|nr:hypothetical protein MSG28_006015 [Choristoneura fumiferana]
MTPIELRLPSYEEATRQLSDLTTRRRRRRRRNHSHNDVASDNVNNIERGVINTQLDGESTGDSNNGESSNENGNSNTRESENDRFNVTLSFGENNVVIFSSNNENGNESNAADDSGVKSGSGDDTTDKLDNMSISSIYETASGSSAGGGDSRAPCRLHIIFSLKFHCSWHKGTQTARWLRLKCRGVQSANTVTLQCIAFAKINEIVIVSRSSQDHNKEVNKIFAQIGENSENEKGKSNAADDSRVKSGSGNDTGDKFDKSFNSRLDTSSGSSVGGEYRAPSPYPPESSRANEEEEERRLLRTIEHRRGNMLKHLIRHDSYIKTILEGRIEGRRGGGRARRSFIDPAKEKVNVMSYQELKTLAENRKEDRNRPPIGMIQVPRERHQEGNNPIPNGIPHVIPNGIPHGIPNGIPHGIPNGIPNGIPHGIPNGIPHGIPNGIPHGIPNGIPRGIPNGIPHGIPNDASVSEECWVELRPTTHVRSERSERAAVAAGDVPEPNC